MPKLDLNHGGLMINRTKNTVLAYEVAFAFSFWRRLRGLMFRRQLPEGEGLLIAPCRSVHTMHMRFAIDVIFLERSGRIVGLEPELRPWRTSHSYADAYYALELPAGTIARTKTELGDLVGS